MHQPVQGQPGHRQVRGDDGRRAVHPQPGRAAGRVGLDAVPQPQPQRAERTDQAQVRRCSSTSVTTKSTRRPSGPHTRPVTPGAIRGALARTRVICGAHSGHRAGTA